MAPQPRGSDVRPPPPSALACALAALANCVAHHHGNGRALAAADAAAQIQRLLVRGLVQHLARAHGWRGGASGECGVSGGGEDPGEGRAVSGGGGEGISVDVTVDVTADASGGGAAVSLEGVVGALRRLRDAAESAGATGQARRVTWRRLRH